MGFVGGALKQRKFENRLAVSCRTQSNCRLKIVKRLTDLTTELGTRLECLCVTITGKHTTNSAYEMCSTWPHELFN
jgi:hypothetical protein